MTDLMQCLTALTVSVGANRSLTDDASERAIETYLGPLPRDSSLTRLALLELHEGLEAAKLDGAKADFIRRGIERRLDDAFATQARL